MILCLVVKLRGQKHYLVKEDLIMITYSHEIAWLACCDAEKGV